MIEKTTPFNSYLMKGITCIDFDYERQILYLIRQQIGADTTDECCIYRLKLKDHLSHPHTNQPIESVAPVVAKLQLFTKPLSVFTRG